MEDAQLIGRGAFGFVVVLNQIPKIAAKWIQQNDDPKEEAKFEREWKILKELHHPNIVYFYGIEKAKDWGQWYHVIKMEYCERNSLRKVLPDPKILYNTKTVYVWTEQLFSVLKCLDEQQVIHRDLKPENVMVTYHFILKVGDFGLVRDLNKSSMTTMAGTPLYMSPELLRGFGNEKPKATSLSDLYAVGLIIWEIIERTRVYPQFAASPSGIGAFLLNVEKGEIRVPVPDCDEKLKGIVISCTEINPTERIPIQEVYPKVVAANKTITKYDFTPMVKEKQTILLKPKDVDELIDKELLVKMLEIETSFQENSATVEVLTNNSSNSLPSDPNTLLREQSWVRYPAKSFNVDPMKQMNIIHQQFVMKEQLKAREDKLNDVIKVAEELVSKTGTSSSDIDDVEDECLTNSMKQSDSLSSDPQVDTENRKLEIEARIEPMKQVSAVEKESSDKIEVSLPEAGRKTANNQKLTLKPKEIKKISSKAHPNDPTTDWRQVNNEQAVEARKIFATLKATSEEQKLIKKTDFDVVISFLTLVPEAEPLFKHLKEKQLLIQKFFETHKFSLDQSLTKSFPKLVGYLIKSRMKMTNLDDETKEILLKVLRAWEEKALNEITSLDQGLIQAFNSLYQGIEDDVLKAIELLDALKNNWFNDFQIRLSIFVNKVNEKFYLLSKEQFFLLKDEKETFTFKDFEGNWFEYIDETSDRANFSSLFKRLKELYQLNSKDLILKLKSRIKVQHKPITFPVIMRQVLHAELLKFGQDRDLDFAYIFLFHFSPVDLHWDLATKFSETKHDNNQINHMAFEEGLRFMANSYHLFHPNEYLDEGNQILSQFKSLTSNHSFIFLKNKYGLLLEYFEVEDESKELFLHLDILNGCFKSRHFSLKKGNLYDFYLFSTQRMLFIFGEYMKFLNRIERIPVFKRRQELALCLRMAFNLDSKEM